MTVLEQAFAAIDAKNAEDPNYELVDGEQVPKELLYSRRMSARLQDFDPEAPETLQIAARAQHICRWQIPRDSYPMNRTGYLKWREDLKKMHASITTGILENLGFTEEFRDRVAFLIRKKLLKKDEDSQKLEDVICLVFLDYYFEDFAKGHPEEKVIDILQKTWAKMSEAGHKAALSLDLSPKTRELVTKALT
ncbi:DUF4202 domain-containing protein [Leeuwenhoekiella sp. H156]|uniref:DUF4202 domain-containing protein n=1 Tax=Leeuwenhoekiella sp. H156 TaxID=3450128 RepID=UPI003FA46F12